MWEVVRGDEHELRVDCVYSIEFLVTYWMSVAHSGDILTRRSVLHSETSFVNQFSSNLI